MNKPKVLITGAASGIGRATAIRFANEGYDICANDIQADKLETLLTELPSGNHLQFAGSFADAGSISLGEKILADNWGALDALVNCAGVSQKSDPLKMDLSRWRVVFDIMVNGCVMISQLAAKFMKNAINWFEIYVSDFSRAKKFYTDVFGYALTDLPMTSERHPEMNYATFPADEKGGGASGALVKMDMAKPGIGGTLVYFATGEINTELGRVEAAGGKIIRPKQDIGDFGFIALVEDSEGNMIGLHSMK